MPITLDQLAEEAPKIIRATHMGLKEKLGGDVAVVMILTEFTPNGPVCFGSNVQRPDVITMLKVILPCLSGSHPRSHR